MTTVTVPSFVKEAFTEGINEILAMCDNEQCDEYGYHPNYKGHDYNVYKRDGAYNITTTYKNIGYHWSTEYPTIITIIKSDDFETYEIKEEVSTEEMMRVFFSAMREYELRERRKKKQNK